MKKYGAFDLGSGLIISLNPEFFENDVPLMIPNVFVVQNQIGKINPPDQTLDNMDWDIDWERRKQLANKITRDLNNELINEEEAKFLIEVVNGKEI